MNYPFEDLCTNLKQYRKHLKLMIEQQSTWVHESDIKAVAEIVKQYEDAIKLLEKNK